MSGLLDELNQRTRLVGHNRLELLLFFLHGGQCFGINVVDGMDKERRSEARTPSNGNLRHRNARDGRLYLHQSNTQ